ncbi:unnamed protein product [Rhizophagus irregularis]|nr:unnamed protein product [Rhizophagus irregularis]
MRDSKNTNEWINWIEEAIVKEHLKLYEYNQFKIVCELKNQRKVDFLDNIIRCHGITKFESGITDQIVRGLSIVTCTLTIYYGQPPFYVENEEYDVGLAVEISQGLREIVVPDTPVEYVKIYTKCWDGEPDNRPTIYQVVDRLSAIITKTDIIIENPQLSSNQEFNEAPLSINNSKLQGELSKPNTKEIDTTAVSDKQEKSLTDKDFNRIFDEIKDLIINVKLLNKKIEGKLIKERAIENFNNYNNDYYNNDDYNQDVILCDSSRVDTYNSNSITYRNIGNYLKNQCEIIEHQEKNIVSIHPTINNRFEIFCLKLEQIDLFRSLMYKYYESGCELTGTWDEPLSFNTGYLCDPAFKEYVEFFDKYKEITLYFTEGLERVNSDEYKYALAYFKYAIDLENDWISNLFVTDNDKKGELVKLNKLNGEKLRRSKEIDSYAKACLKVEHDGLLSKIHHEPYRTRGLKDGLQTLPYIVAYIGASNCAEDELFKRFRDEFKELIEGIDFTEEQQTLIHNLLEKYTQPEESLELKPSDEVEPDEYLCERYETALKRCSSGLKCYEVPYI